jgi:hypothetical protein
MFRWVDAEESLGQSAACDTGLVPQDGTPAAAPETLYRFAAEHNGNELRLYMDLVSDSADAKLPALSLRAAPADCKLETSVGRTSESFRICVIVPPAPAPADDDELVINILGDPADRVPGCRVEVRRTTCRLSTALIERHRTTPPLRR